MIKKIALIFTLAAIATGCGHNSKSASKGPDIKPVIPPATATAPAKSAPATPAKPAMLDVFTCTRDSDVREIYTEPVTPVGCKLWYSNRKTEPTAWSTLGTDHCLGVGSRIRGNLESAGYKCAPVAAVHAK